MELFGDAFKKAKIAKNATLRELATATGKSIGYLSDVLQKRKAPPDLETVAVIERVLDIKNNSLSQLARKEREGTPTELARRVRSRPLLREALTRMNDMTDEDLEKVVDKLPGNFLLFKARTDEEAA